MFSLPGNHRHLREETNELRERKKKREAPKCLWENGYTSFATASRNHARTGCATNTERKVCVASTTSCSHRRGWTGYVANFVYEVVKRQLRLSVGGLGGQGVEQFGRSEALVSGLDHQLFFLYHVHEFDTDERPLCCIE
jgi:hypothetical protein